MFKFNYDIKKYDFKSLFCRWLNTDDLTTLHNEKKYPVLTREEDMYMHWNQIYYKRMAYAICHIFIIYFSI